MTITVTCIGPVLLAAALVQASSAAALAQSARDDHMTSMDAFFACAFGEMRNARAEGLSTEGYVVRLDQLCGAAEQELRKRSMSLAMEQGLGAQQARAKASEVVDQARKDLIAVYQGR
jgi:hypothetical protein